MAFYLYFYVSFISQFYSYISDVLLSAPKESESVEDNLKSIIAKMTPTLIFQGQDYFIC